MRRVIRSNASPGASFASVVPTESLCRRCRARRSCLADPVNVLRTEHQADGLVVHARTAMPLWLGERLDVAYAIDVLHPLASGQ